MLQHIPHYHALLPLGDEPPDLHRGSKEQSTAAESRSSSPGKGSQAEGNTDPERKCSILEAGVAPIGLHFLFPVHPDS